MILGRVVGEVWATRKHARLAGVKLLLVRPYLWFEPSHAVDHLVAADVVGAGVGEDVIVCMGDPARRCLGSVNLPVEAAVLGIVDRCQLARDAFRGPRPLAFIGGEAPAGTEWR